MESIERAAFDLDSPPDRWLGFFQCNLELKETLGGRDRADALAIFNGFGRGFDGVPQRVPLHSILGLADGGLGLLLDVLQLGQREENCSLVLFFQLEPVD